MPTREGNIWIKNDRLFMIRNRQEWSFLGKDVGVTSEPAGAFWIEGDYFCYVDKNQRKRIIDTVQRGSSAQPPSYVAIDPERWLWFSKPEGVNQVKRATFHTDFSGGYSDHGPRVTQIPAILIRKS